MNQDVFEEPGGGFLSKMLTIGFGPQYSADLVQYC